MKKYIRGTRDSLGVPIEPDEELPLFDDYFDNPIHEGDLYFVIDNDIIIDEKDAIYDYIKQNFDRREA